MKRYVKRQYGGNMVKHCGAFIQHRSNCNDAHKHNSVCGAIQNGSFNAESYPASLQEKHHKNCECCPVSIFIVR